MRFFLRTLGGLESRSGGNSLIHLLSQYLTLRWPSFWNKSFLHGFIMMSQGVQHSRGYAVTDKSLLASKRSPRATYHKAFASLRMRAMTVLFLARASTFC